LKKNYKSYYLLIPISGTIIILDQITKTIVRNNIPYGQFWSPLSWMTPYVRIVHWNNTGVAFGLFQGQGILFTILAFVIALAILFYYPQFTEKDWLLRIALGMQFGGAVGNLIDRITIGHVTDFISIGNFPVFNVADSCITVGVCVMIIGLWLKDRQEKKMDKSKQPLKPVDQSEPITPKNKPSNE
jgi:signal peptidase II